MTRGDDTARLARHYSEQASAYAACWSPVISAAGRRLLEQLPWSGVRRVLDVGTGTGAHLADVRRLAPGAWILGLDRAEGMLRLARSHGTPLALMDAMQLGVREASFDLALMVFMLFHLDDPVAALRGVRRALRPGGALGVVTWADDPDVEASRVWEAALDALGARDPDPIPRRHDLMDTPAKVSGLLSEAGLAPRKVWTETLEHAWSADTLFVLHTGFGRARRKLDSLPPAVRSDFLRRARERLAALPPEAYRYRAVVVCGVALREA